MRKRRNEIEQKEIKQQIRKYTRRGNEIKIKGMKGKEIGQTKEEKQWNRRDEGEK